MSKVVSYPKSLDQRLSEAIELYRSEKYGYAIELFKRLVDDGCDHAFVYLGGIYASRNSGYCDLDSAYFYYTQAAERGGYVHAYLGLIGIHLYGDVHLKDYSKAREYCELLIEKFQQPFAYFYLGHIHAEGMGVEVNLEKAIECFRKAWEGGYVFGLTFIGLVECGRRHHLKGWWYRLRAGWQTIKLANAKKDWRIAVPSHWMLPDYKKYYRY